MLIISYNIYVRYTVKHTNEQLAATMRELSRVLRKMFIIDGSLTNPTYIKARVKSFNFKDFIGIINRSTMAFKKRGKEHFHKNAMYARLNIVIVTIDNIPHECTNPTFMIDTMTKLFTGLDTNIDIIATRVELSSEKFFEEIFMK